MAEVSDASTERDHTPPPSEPSATASPATVIPLSLTEDYAPAWGVWEGVRELVQNWHDGCLEQTSVAGRIRWESHADDAAGALQRFEAVDADGGREQCDHQYETPIQRTAVRQAAQDDAGRHQRVARL